MAKVKTKKIGSPRKCKIFNRYWDMLILQVSAKKNYNDSHKELVFILCDLYVEYHDLSKYIKENGYAYEEHGRYGLQIKKWAQVEQMNTVRKEIRAYTKELNVSLSPEDKPDEKEGDEWN